MARTAAKVRSLELPSIHDLSAGQKQAFMREVFARRSRFQSEFGADAADIDCGEFAEAFQKQLVRLLGRHGIKTDIQNLSNLHETVSDDMKAYGYDDGVNGISGLLYDTDEEFYRVYHRFIKECIATHFEYPFYFQATTTIRVHCPGGKNVNHYPRYHTDIGYGHPPEEVNIWIPLTEPQAPQQHGFRRMGVEDSRKVLERFDYDFAPLIDKAIEDKPFNYELNDFAPEVATKLGRGHAFDSRCIHTGEPLIAHTRISMDIRLIPVEDFNAMPYAYRGTGRRQIPYQPGEAYFTQSSDQL